MIDFLKNNRKRIIFTLVFLVFLLMPALNILPDGSFGFQDVLAGDDELKDVDNVSGIEEKIILVISYIFYGMAVVIGKLGTFLINATADIAGWNTYLTDVNVVETGWNIVKNLCNMFFILILLVIAFATVLRVENYNIKKWLPKVIIMAVLINFSFMICLVIVDASHVIMDTFANQLAGGNNLVVNLGMDHMLDFVKESDEADNLGWSTLGGVILAFFALLIAIIVVLALFATLLFRVIMLWVYTILSPFAFLLSAFPHGQKYASQWWSEFSKQVIGGPVLVFFLWLALKLSSENMSILEVPDEMAGNMNNGLFQDEVFATYAVTIGLLIGGLVVTQQVGGVAGKMAGKAMGAIQKGQAKIKGGVKGSAKWAGKTAASTGLRGAGSVLKKLPTDSVRKTGNFATRWGQDIQKNRNDAVKNSLKNGLKKMGMREEAHDDAGEKGGAIQAAGEVADTTAGRYTKTGLATAGGAGLALSSPWLAAPMLGLAASHWHETHRKGKSEKKIKEAEDEKRNLEEDRTKKTEQAKEAINYENKKKDAENNKKIEIKKANESFNRGDIEAEILQSNIKDAEVKFNTAVKDLEDELTEEKIKRKAGPELDNQIKEQDDIINEEKDRKLRSVPGTGPGEKLSSWHPNKVLKSVADDAAKSQKKTNQQMDVLSSGAFKDSGKAYYHAMGQTADNKRLLNALNKGDKKSLDALGQIDKTLEGLARKQTTTGLSDAEKALVHNFKQGLAAFEKGGGDTTTIRNKLSIQNLEQIKTSEEGQDAIEDLKPKVIEKN